MVDPERNATDIDTVFELHLSFSVYSRHTQVHVMAWNAHVYLVFADVKFFQNFNIKYT